MKHMLCAFVAVMAFAGAAEARNVYVAGHYLANGRYVPPHYVTVPDGPVYPGYGAVDPDVNGAPVPVPYPYGAPYAPYQGTPYVPAPGYVPNSGYVPGYGYIPR